VLSDRVSGGRLRKEPGVAAWCAGPPSRSRTKGPYRLGDHYLHSISGTAVRESRMHRRLVE
jgi:hypothetical protein